MCRLHSIKRPHIDHCLRWCAASLLLLAYHDDCASDGPRAMSRPDKPNPLSHMVVKQVHLCVAQSEIYQ